MATTTRKITTKPTITIDVIALLNSVGLSKKEINAYTPIIKQDAVKKEIGVRYIETMLSNTLSGYDKKGNRFAGYSKAYRKSPEFKIYKGSKRIPDLKLTGEMQADINVLSTTSTTVTIGFMEEGDGSKAKGHILGARYLPKRDFFGMKKVDLSKIMLDVITDYEQNVSLGQLDIIESIESESSGTILDLFLGENVA